VAKRRSAADIAAEMEVVRTDALALTEAEGTDEELEANITRSQELLSQWDELDAEYQAAVAYEKRIEAIRSKALDARNTESGDGAAPAKYLGEKGPEIKRNLDPYEGQELIRAGVIAAPDAIARAKNAVEAAPQHMNDAAREHVTRLLELEGKQAPLIARHMLMTGSPEYHEAFREYVETRGYANQVLRTAMSLTDANGGYLVPFTLDPTIILTNSGIADPIRMISRNVQIATDSWNGVSSAGVSAEWLGEGVEAADASPTFAQPSITPKKAAAWVFGSYEMLADSGFASEVSRLLADAKTRLEGAAFATGNTGATRPRGIVAAAAAVTASIVTAATTNAFVVGDVYRVADALRPRDAAKASWIANKRIYSLIRQMDTAGGSAFWANLGMNVPAQLLGQPQYEASTMSSVVTTGGNILLAGNFEQYVVVDRVGMSIMYEPMVKSTGNGRPTGQAGWFAFWRVGADVTDVDAFRLLQLNQVAAATALA
jgi:HK97 family phage major capsid protein